MIKHAKSVVAVQSVIAGYAELELDIESVLRAQIPGLFEATDAAPLTGTNVSALPVDAKGAYLLLHDGTPVYAGKTDSRHGFQDRLRRHWFSLQHRNNLRIQDMAFKAVRVMVFSNFDIEAILIQEMRKRGATFLDWNNSGFGSNDPGHRREAQEPAVFDERFPIDIDKSLNKIKAGTYTVRDLLVQVKADLPYLFRYQTDMKGGQTNRTVCEPSAVGHEDQRKAHVAIPNNAPTMREILRAVVDALPDEWQGTVFPGRVILYREKTKYARATATFS